MPRANTLSHEECGQDQVGVLEESRALSVMRVASVMHAGKVYLGLLRSISATQFSVELNAKIPSGDVVVVSFRDGQEITGTITRDFGETAKISLHEPIDVDDCLAFVGRAQNSANRRLPRVSINRKIGLREVETGSTATVELVDVSQCGAKVRFGTDAKIRGSVSLRLDDLGVHHGQVRWRAGQEVGLSFNIPISLHRLAKWIES